MADRIFELFPYILFAVLMPLSLFATGKQLFRSARSRFGPVKTVQARVVDKFKDDRAARIYGRMSRTVRCYVVFAIGDKKKAFAVSEFSYGGYRLNETGTLKYQGDRIIDFH